MTDRLALLEARVQRVEDREEIHALFMRYRQCLDEKDFGGYAGLFSRDGEFVAAGGSARGAPASRSWSTACAEACSTAVAGDDLHIVVNPEITVDGDRARARSTWIFLVRGDDGDPTLARSATTRMTSSARTARGASPGASRRWTCHSTK